MKNIVNLNDKLQDYDHKDHVGMISNQYCEGIEPEVIFLRVDLEKSNKQNENLIKVFEEYRQKEEILNLK